VVRKTLRILTIAAGALLLGVTVAAAQYDDGRPTEPIAAEGRIAYEMKHPILNGGVEPLEYHIPTPPAPVPEGHQAGPVGGDSDGVLKSGESVENGGAIVGPRGSGSIYSEKQQANREIRRLIRALED
jgi:hypothetical protein